MSDRRVSPAGESFRRRHRLRRSRDFVRCYREGRRRYGQWTVLYAVGNDCGHARLGLTVSRKVGKSVLRHKIKRRIREIFRRWDQRTELPAVDLLFHVKTSAGQADFDSLRTEVERLLTWAARRTFPPPAGSC